MAGFLGVTQRYTEGMDTVLWLQAWGYVLLAGHCEEGLVEIARLGESRG